MGRVNGKVAWVTGAGMGLGRAAASLLAREGAALFCTDIAREHGEETVRLIRDAGGVADFFQHDVTDPGDWEAASSELDRLHGRLDVMVNNAGISHTGDIESCSLEAWRHTMAVNAEGVFLGCKHAVALMKRTTADKTKSGGSIVNLSSIDGIIGEGDLVAYCASKGAVRTLTKAVAVHCAQQKYGIRCNSIHPGYIWTPQTEAYVREQADAEQRIAGITARHPIGFLGEADDVAYMVLYLASEESKFVTGSEMVVDGGYLMV
jgi:3(or 17)beta-hydroxysteroid dehydrogenase